MPFRDGTRRGHGGLGKRRRPRRLVPLTLLAGALGATALLPGPAGALTNDPSAGDWVTNGPVYTVTRAGGRTFIGGDFTRIGRRTGHGVPIDAASGQPAGGFGSFPEISGGELRAVVSDGAGGWYVGGDFTHVGGFSRSRLAHIRPAAGGGLEVDPDWQADVTGASVRALALGDSESERAAAGGAAVLYVGGTFTNVRGTSRTNLAAVRTAAGLCAPGTPTTSCLTGWAPEVDDWVHALTTVKFAFDVTVDGVTTRPEMSMVFAGGDFTKAGGDTTNPRIAAIWGLGSKNNVGTSTSQLSPKDAGTGGASGWRPNLPATVRAIAVGAPKIASPEGTDAKRAYAVYLGGDFTGTTERVAAMKFEVATKGTTTSGMVTASSSYSNWTPCNATTTPTNEACGGPVRALAVTGAGATETLYLGGDFTKMGPHTSPSPKLPRNRLAALKGIENPAGSGNLAELKTWDPNANERVRALTQVPDGTIYATGDFTQVKGETREGLVALDPVSGVPTGWNPSATGGVVSQTGGHVNALAVSGSTVFAGGSFTSVGAAERKRLAAFESNGELVAGWDPAATNTCTVVDPATSCNDGLAGVYAAVPVGDTLYIGGHFKQIDGQPRSLLAAVSTVDGSLLPWDPSVSSRCSTAGCTPPPSQVIALAATGDTIYAGGAFTHIREEGRANIAAIDPASGAPTAWNPSADDNVYSILAACSAVYAGGSFANIGGQPRGNVAVLDPATGAAVDEWDPQANSAVHTIARYGANIYVGGQFSVIGGAVHHKVAAIDATTGTATRWNPSVNAGGTVRALALPADGTTIYVGGTFTSIGGENRLNVAAVDPETGRAGAWNPGASESVRALTTSGANLYLGGEFRQVGINMQQGFASFSEGAGADTSEAPLCSARSSAPAGGGEEPPPPPSGAPAPARDLARPIISAFSITNKRFRVAPLPRRRASRRSARRRAAKAPVGTTFRYSASEAVDATILLERRLAGWRSGKRCVARRPRKPKRPRHCALYRAAGTLRDKGRAGTNAVPFNGRIRRRALRLGLYRATLLISDGTGNISRRRRLNFRVVGG